MSTYEDSTGRTLRVGDRVRFRGTAYTIRAFHAGEGRGGTARLEFVEPQHTDEPADEVSVDLLLEKESST
jgi:hypothetical protein